ncbi:MAG TPA: hypothetical protein PKK23_17635 [Nitrospirales bacterium]|nr:hypothetical protein [Nitrospiraceae bacterium]HNP30870.1 hypothetical protein [Nitrospirales bacterium]
MNGSYAQMAIMSQFSSLFGRDREGEIELAFDGIRAACVFHLAGQANVLQHEIESSARRSIEFALSLAERDLGLGEALATRSLSGWLRGRELSSPVDPSNTWFEAFRVVEIGLLDKWPLKRTAILLAKGTTSLEPFVNGPTVSFVSVVEWLEMRAQNVDDSNGVSASDRIFIELVCDLADFYKGLLDFVQFISIAPVLVRPLLGEYLQTAVFLGRPRDAVVRLHGALRIGQEGLRRSNVELPHDFLLQSEATLGWVSKMPQMDEWSGA